MEATTLTAQLQSAAKSVELSQDVSPELIVPPALASDAARFANLMKPAEVQQAAASPMGVPANGEATAINEPKSFGDVLLEGMANSSKKFRHTLDSAKATFQEDGMLKMERMMTFQWQLTQTMVEFDLVAKGISRSTQNIDQLVRIQ